MDGEGATFRELLAYTDSETERWRDWFGEQGPEVLDIRIGEGTRETVRDLIGHVFAVELRYAQRLLGLPVTEFEQLDTSSLDALWRIHRTSRYYRTVKALPPNWKYESATASTLVS